MASEYCMLRANPPSARYTSSECLAATILLAAKMTSREQLRWFLDLFFVLRLIIIIFLLPSILRLALRLFALPWCLFIALQTTTKFIHIQLNIYHKQVFFFFTPIGRSMDPFLLSINQKKDPWIFRVTQKIPMVMYYTDRYM